MNFLYKLMKKDPHDREGAILVTSVMGIIMNLIIAAIKLIIGAAVSSIAIISEGVNNATDAVTSVMAVAGTKLSAKRPDKKHPFGYGRIEYLTSLLISVLIIVSGFEMFTSSVRLIIRPEPISISYTTLLIIALSGVIKYVQGTYTVKVGKRVDSGSLVAVGTECRSDSLVSLVTIISSVIFLVSGVSVDAYAGAVTSLFILKAGIEVLLDTVSQILGEAGKKDLADMLYREIRSTEGILNAADMMLHNYGPDSYSGSVNVELDHKLTVGEAYAFLHELQLRIMHEHNVVMVFGIYAVNNDEDDSRLLRERIAEFVRKTEHILSFHAVYIDRSAMRIYCDFTVDYQLPDPDAVDREFTQYMKELYPEYSLELTIETDFV
ncbi:MAG: cation diffusion facilitator family transporter [Eubacteriales bacterium]|nr:cation diffusion facilitator family transporter [Eubacteriales bacterium]